MKTLRTWSVILILAALVVACELPVNFVTQAEPTTAPTMEQLQVATEMPVAPTDKPQVPTEAPPSLPAATPEQVSNVVPTEIPYYLTDHFENGLENWSYEVHSGNENLLTITTESSGIVARLDDPNLYVYFFYTPYTYADVILELTAENRGRNSNNVNVVCRYSDAGWYEFTIQNDGLYQIWAYTTGAGYDMLYSGGSTQIHQGLGTNVITVGCVGNGLSLWINGVETRTIQDTHHYIPQGYAGFGVNISPSNPVTPVIVNFDSFTIAGP